MTRALKLAQSLACLDQETAAGMFYTLTRGGKKIMGPSTRLAEIVAGAWGNMRVDAGVESTDTNLLTAVATCWDLETNVAIRVRVQQRITDKNGKRYGDDMIVTAGTLSGRLEASTTLRPKANVCSPTWLTQPMMTSSIAAGSTPASATSASSISAPRSAG